MEHGDWGGAGLVDSFYGHRDAWKRALSVLGQNTSRTAPVRSKRVIAKPFIGIWPEAAQRYFHPLIQACSDKYRRGLSV
jgi:hypothetical protein